MEFYIHSGHFVFEMTFLCSDTMIILPPVFKKHGGFFMRKTSKMTLTAMLIAIGTLTSHMFYIPIGFTKVFPMQHFINVLSAVLLGPGYAVMQALSVSILRNLMGTGSLFAFPGSIIGAFLAAYLFKKTRKLTMALCRRNNRDRNIRGDRLLPNSDSIIRSKSSFIWLYPIVYF